MSGRQRTLIVIGGHEERCGKERILHEVVRHVGKGRLVVTTVASGEPEGLFEEYRSVFRQLGLRRVVNLSVGSRAEALAPEAVRALDEATGIFFTGGNQLKITSEIGGTPLFHRMLEIYHHGGVIAGTSAGASAVCETMLTSGCEGHSSKVEGSFRAAPGLGLLRGAVVDQHFAERGRLGRLLAAIGTNPEMLGIGIDENTAIVVQNDEFFRVLGDGAVYVVDGSGISSTNIAEADPKESLSLFDIKLHVLSEADRFHFSKRIPEGRHASASALA